MIKAAELKDAELLNQLVNAAYRGDSSRQGWTTEADLLDGTRTDRAGIEELLNHPGTKILKYVEDGVILGCVELAHRENGLYLGMLTVQPGHQSKGIGKKLLLAAEEEAIQQGLIAIFMTVISVRHELIAWYVRHGYVDTGERKPFVVPDIRWGIPKTKLEFSVLKKTLSV